MACFSNDTELKTETILGTEVTFISNSIQYYDNGTIKEGILIFNHVLKRIYHQTFPYHHSNKIDEILFSNDWINFYENGRLKQGRVGSNRIAK